MPVALLIETNPRHDGHRRPRTDRALFYSFVVTAKVNGVNPYEALKTIFTELPLATTADDFDRLAQILLGTKS
jgi:hypothetical protein